MALSQDTYVYMETYVSHKQTYAFGKIKAC